jgi:serine/threonine protein kinase
VLLKVYTLNIYAEKQEQERQRELLTRDAEALYRVGTNANIVRVVGFFPWEADQFVLAMEWPNLHSLRSTLAESGPMKVADVLSLADGILSGLAYVHENGVIHRNLRPESVLVGPGGAVKLANFDLARVDDGALATIATRVARLIDVRYAAPEVRTDPSRAVTQSDLFSVGQIMREALTGSLSGVVTGDIGEIIGRLTAAKVSERYESAASAADDIAILM